MKDVFRSAFAQSVIVTDDTGCYAARAFIEPLHAETPEAPEITEAGLVDGRRWRVILPPMELAGAVTVTDADGEVYRLLRRELIGNGHHIEAVARREEAATA